MPPKSRRGRHEGGVVKLPSGSYRGTISLGKDKDGNRLRETVTRATKAECLAAMRSRMSEIGAGSEAAERGLTVSQWLTRWLASGKVGAGTQAVRRSRCRHVAQSDLADVPLVKLRIGHIAAWLAAMEETSVPAGERSATLRQLRTALNEAVREGLITANPADKARGPKRVKPDRRSMTPEEARTALCEADARGLGLYMLLALDSGCRPGELLALRRCDLDGDTLHVRRSLAIVGGHEKRTKTEEGDRRITLAPGTVRRIEQEGGTDLIIPRPKTKQVYKDWLYPALKRLFRAAGVAWAVPYTTRHTCASLLLREGVRITTVAQRLGHADASVTLRFYAHAIEGDQRQAALVTARLFAA